MTSPDTNTLNGALEQLGITMAENLVTMGVSDADPSDGLTTLAQKILQVSPTPASWDGMSLEKTAGKQILSYVDYSSSGNTEYCTVTAQLLDGASSATISGVPVVFGAYQNDVLITGSEESVNTDSNGQASYTYTSQGLGDIVVKAVPDERSLLTKTYAIEDCIRYLTDIPYSDQSNLNYSLPSSFKMEFRLYATQLNRGSSNVAYIRFNSSSGVFVGKASNNNGTIYYLGQTLGTMTVNTDCDFVLTYENGSSSLTDGTTTKTSSETLSNIYGISSWNYSYFKYIKIKPL